MKRYSNWAVIGVVTHGNHKLIAVRETTSGKIAYMTSQGCILASELVAIPLGVR